MRPSLHYVLYVCRLAGAETQTTSAERDCIARYARGKRLAAEIGVWHGVTTCRIARELAPSGVVYAVDNYRPGAFGFSFQQRIAQHQTRAYREQVRFVVANSETAAAELRKKVGCAFDLVFVDGDHSYEGIETDWSCWSGMIVPNGIVALHDSRSTPERNIEDAGSVIFTREVILNDSRFELLEQVDSLSVLRRR